MKRVAIPVKKNKLSEYFGVCSYYEVFDIGNGKIQKHRLKIPTVNDIAELPEWLSNKGITDVITHKINKNIISLFASRKVNLFVGIEVKSSKKIIDDYLQGNLESDKNIIKELTTN